uniref:alpha-L-rhamnosidase n=1 Tax=Amorphochlora amoebiformis TaxID=1561963 RepID=A0A7S0CSK0_9EUKA|mmetsp:Transcript_12528/g.19924  ORF Transcript_12528/g.19924 Transcript_12528/m.19924 type:complete len:979 (+) Transcript_12528:42-2978(+)
MRSLVLLPFLGLCGAISTLPAATDLRIDGLDPSIYSDPWKVGLMLAVDTPNPVFSWSIPPPPTGQRGVQVAAVRVIVQLMMGRCSYDGNTSSPCTAWDSGAVKTTHTHLRYEGPPLVPSRRFCYSVWWQSNKGTWAPVSEHACFETGVSDWGKSVWIGDDHLNQLRKEVTVPEALMELAVGARIYASGLGWAQIFLNGQRISYNESLGVGWTRYDKRALYTTYSVLPLLRRGTNAIGVALGYGWRDTLYFPPKFAYDSGSGYTAKALRLILSLQMSNGSWVDLAWTDSSWKGVLGPVVFDSVYDGEVYNASREQPGWTEANFNQSAWTPVADISNEGWAVSTTMRAQAVPPIRNLAILAAVKATAVGTGHFIYDFGHDLSGYCRVTLPNYHVPKNTTFTIRHAEALIHPPYGTYGVNNSFLYYENLRSALATDKYTFSGNEIPGQVWEPTFTYHGFRYAEVTGWPCPDPKSCTPPDIKLVHIRTAIDVTGRVNTSEPLVNAIQRMVVGAIGSNAMSVMTDCPQRDERLGWLGDVHASAQTIELNYDIRAFMDQYLEIIVDDQNPTLGTIPDVVPYYRYGGMPGDPSWTTAFPELLWSRYRLGGTLVPYGKHREALFKLLQHMTATVTNQGGFGNMTDWGYYGDWVPAKAADKPSILYTSAASYISALRKSYLMATAYGDTELAKEYIATYKKMRKCFLDTFFSTKTYAFENGGQSAQAIGLDATEISVKEGLAEAYQVLMHRVGDDDYKLTVGVLGNKVIWDQLANSGNHTALNKLLKQTLYPSFGYMHTNNIEPATVNLWELWDAPAEGPGMDSRNHHMFASVGAFLYRYAGFSGLENNPPAIDLKVGGCCGGLSSGSVQTKLLHGTVKFSWDLSPATKASSANVTLPSGVGAILHIPIPHKETCTIRLYDHESLIFSGRIKSSTSKLSISDVDGIMEARVEKASRSLLLRIASGEFKFSMESNLWIPHGPGVDPNM